ncbi:PAAR domain-containing protein [Acinetobacter sp. WZC-1]|uniref:PAAR domain-containing protein n=1 Tax=Acinetobacter sp. WZC-1 TaxID=3459034 RepID=UPI00403DE5DA
MVKGFAIHNSMTTHGGIIQATQQRASQMGNLFLRAGDGHYCPQCKCWSTIQPSHNHIIMYGQPVAYVDDLLSCGARILPKQVHVVGDSGGISLRFSTPVVQPISSQQSLNNSLVAEDKKLLNGHYYNVETGIFEGKITNGTGQIEDLYACNRKEGNDYKNKKKLEMTHSEVIPPFLIELMGRKSKAPVIV